ncbi:MAG: hypothetical protein HYU78_12620 [Rhodocyclales bacterium]|nr:hypothetical protein [Rhodocyclales bacterium]
MPDPQRRFEYRLRFPDGQQRVIPIVLDGATLGCIEPPPAARAWTALDCHRCPHCPLEPAAEPLCPLAARLDPLVDILGSVLSHQTLDVEVVAGERTVATHAPAQAVASSIIGLIGATSGCPHTAFLKPLAWFHQPFAGEEETVFRAVSAWFLKQHFRDLDGETPDWSLAGLRQRYDALHTVNVHLARRLRQASSCDATVNAIVRLDMFTKAVSGEIDEILGFLRGRLG